MNIQNDFFMRTYQRIIYSYKQLLRENNIYNIIKFLSKIDRTGPNGHYIIFDCFILACESRKYSLIDHFIKNLRFDITQENSECKTVLYILSDSDRNSFVIDYLIKKFNTDINLKNTIYIPIFNCFSLSFCKENFNIFIQNKNINLDVIDSNNNTILYNLIYFNNMPVIKQLCNVYISKYGYARLRRWVQYNNCIELCFNCNFIIDNIEFTK